VAVRASIRLEGLYQRGVAPHDHPGDALVRPPSRPQARFWESGPARDGDRSPPPPPRPEAPSTRPSASSGHRPGGTCAQRPLPVAHMRCAGRVPTRVPPGRPTVSLRGGRAGGTAMRLCPTPTPRGRSDPMAPRPRNRPRNPPHIHNRCGSARATWRRRAGSGSYPTTWTACPPGGSDRSPRRSSRRVPGSKPSMPGYLTAQWRVSCCLR
jgi:hypothetical protein